MECGGLPAYRFCLLYQFMNQSTSHFACTKLPVLMFLSFLAGLRNAYDDLETAKSTSAS